jgi:Phage integrase family
VIGANGARRLKSPPNRLLQKHAILGGCPALDVGVPEVHCVCGAPGRANWFIKRSILNPADGLWFDVEVDGMSATAKRPLPGAYRKQYLDPDMMEVGIDRGEYEIWRACLEILADDLDGKFESKAPIRSPRPLRPWEDRTFREPLILHVTLPPLRPERPTLMGDLPQVAGRTSRIKRSIASFRFFFVSRIPLLPHLAEIIDATKTVDLTFVATPSGRPMTKENFGNWFRDACRAAKVPGAAHGLRKAAATRLANNGATEAELEAIFGWRGGRVASLYTRQANRVRLAGSGMAEFVRPKD